MPVYPERPVVIAGNEPVPMRLKANPSQQAFRALVIAPCLDRLVACYGLSCRHCRQVLVDCQGTFMGVDVVNRLAAMGNEELNS